MTDHDRPVFDNIYDRIDHGGSVYDDIAEMDIDDMMDYFGDLDPVAFL